MLLLFMKMEGKLYRGHYVALPMPCAIVMYEWAKLALFSSLNNCLINEGKLTDSLI